ncbi:MAG: ATP-binding protein [Deltaproteobacteria bacterium]|nr:ATP-binding protein [Deltaproteobacteria bacterium]
MVKSDVKAGLKVESLRRLIIVVLTASVLVFAAGTFLMLQRIFDNFGPGVRSDLQWKAQRGAAEIARTAELGLAIDDKAMVEDAIADFKKSDDILAIVAVNAKGEPVLTFGTSPLANEKLFGTKPDTIVTNDSYISSWSKSFVETNQVGSVGVVVSTRRLVESRSLLQKVKAATAVAGLLALFGGIGFVVFFTRAILARDKQLAGYAAGLERMVAERTSQLDKANQGMRVVLNNVAQGLAMIDLQGVMAPERSAMMDKWFGNAQDQATFQSLVQPIDARVASAFGMGLEQVRDGFLPAELALDQMPKHITANARELQISYIPLGSGEIPSGLLLVVSDITEQLAHERAEKEQREMMRIFQRIAQDRTGVLEFLNEAQTLAQQIYEGPKDLATEKRLVHTLKGICALFGIDSLATLCHGLETAIDEESRSLSDIDRQSIRREWDRSANAIADLLGNKAIKAVEISVEDHRLLIERLRQRAPVEALERWISSWTMDPVAARLHRFGEQAQKLSVRLGKAPLEVKIDDGGVRLDPATWAPFWNAFSHLIRNAVDHGVETLEQRRAVGKPDAATLRLEVQALPDSFELRVEEDGRGVDWEKVARKAAAAGLPSSTPQDLENALFHDGVSTADEVTVTSGRGVGLAAVKAATQLLGGKVKVVTAQGRGTAFVFTFPNTGSVFGTLEQAVA